MLARASFKGQMRKMVLAKLAVEVVSHGRLGRTSLVRSTIGEELTPESRGNTGS